MAEEYSNLDYDPNASWDGSEDSDVSSNPAVIAAQQQQAVAQPTKGPTHVTYYGYEKKGDPDYDSNSAAGRGDRNNQLAQGSLALSQSERLARFGVTGKSTGLPVVVGGQTIRYDHDT